MIKRYLVAGCLSVLAMALCGCELDIPDDVWVSVTLAVQVNNISSENAEHCTVSMGVGVGSPHMTSQSVPKSGGTATVSESLKLREGDLALAGARLICGGEVLSEGSVSLSYDEAMKGAKGGLGSAEAFTSWNPVITLAGKDKGTYVRNIANRGTKAKLEGQDKLREFREEWESE